MEQETKYLVKIEALEGSLDHVTNFLSDMVMNSHELSFTISPHTNENVETLQKQLAQAKDDLEKYKKENLALKKSVQEKVANAKIYQEYTNTFTQTSSIFLIRTDMQGYYTYVNDAFCQKFGFSEQEIIGTHYAPTVHPDDLHICLAASQACFENPEIAIPVEIRKPNPKGGYFYTKWEFVLIKNLEGEVIEMQAYGIDITKQHLAQDALIASEKKYRELIEHSPDVVLQVDNEGNILYLSPAVEKILGYSAEEIMKNPSISLDIFQPTSIKKFQEFGGFYFKNGYFREGMIDLDWKHRDGRIITIEHNLTNLYQNNQINGFQTVGRDITEIRKAQEENKRLALVAKYTDNLVIITDPKGRIQWVNDTFTKISGYTFEEAFGNRPGKLLQGKESDLNVVKYMSEKIRDKKGFSAELLNYSKTGRKYWVSIDCQPVFDADKEVIYFIAVQTDISRRKRLENKLIKFYQESKAFKAALEKSAIIVVLNKDKKIVQVNQAFCLITGYSEKELIGQPIALFDSELSDSKLSAYIWQAVDQKVFWRSEVCNYAKDQSEYWTDRTINPIQGVGEGFLQYMLVSHDITARKFAEELSRAQAEKLKTKLEHEVAQRTLELKEEKDKANFATKQIRSSIFYAKRIQTAILPTETEMREHLADFFVYNLPKDIVSGDFYWFGIKDEKIILSVIDCTGHGVPGAFMSMIAYSLMNEIIDKRDITEPAKILALLDENVKISLRQKDSQVQDGMDMAICAIDKNTNTLVFGGAKNPLVYVENNELKILKGSRKHIGGKYSSKSFFEEETINIQPDNVYYMFSDGYIDQFGGDQKRKFTRERLQNLFLQIHKKSMLEQMDILDQEFIAWMGGYGVRLDDVLVMGFKI